MELNPFLVVFIHLVFSTVCNSIFFYLLYFEEQTFSVMKDNDFNQALKCHSLGMGMLNASEEEKHHQHKPAGQPRSEEASVCGALIRHPDIEILQLPSQ